MVGYHQQRAYTSKGRAIASLEISSYDLETAAATDTMLMWGP